MKLAVSNIAWSGERDSDMYSFLTDNGFTGLEIAPTRIFPESPYDRLDEAAAFSKHLRDDYGLVLCSMQSVWYGKTGNIFASEGERKELSDYTKKSILFARAAGIGNIVFGCPRNRSIPEGCSDAHDIAMSFFDELGSFAALNGTVIALEANPSCYNTNFLNRTSEVIDFVKELGNKGVKVNADLGTCIFYDEPVSLLRDNIALINHIHISEPMLVPIKKRGLHRELALLDYDRWFSIEMGNKAEPRELEAAISYIGEVFN